MMIRLRLKAALALLVLMLGVTGITVLSQEENSIPLDLLNAAPAEVQAYYMPGDFAGQTLDVVLNASFFNDPAGAAVLNSGKAMFEALTGAVVNYIPLPENQMYDQVRLEMSTNSGAYDMMHTGAGGAKDYGLSGFLIGLPMPPDAADFFQGDLNQYMVGETLYGLPMVADTNILYWRTDLFEAAGLDPATPPQTYEELREYAIRLTTDVNGRHPGEEGFDPNNIEVYGLGFKGVSGLASSWEWYNYLYAFGGDLMDDEFNITIDSPEAVASLQWVVDNFREYNIYPADATTYDYTEFHTLFIQGKMAMAINWPYMWSLIQNPEQSQVVDLVNVGRKPGAVTHGGNIGGWSWNVFTMSDTPELATAFAKWMSGPDFSLAWGRAGRAPVRASVAEVLSVEDPVLTAAIAVNQADGRSVDWLATGPSWMSIEAVQHQAIQEALIGAKTPEEALRDARAEIEEILTDDGFYEEILPQLLGS
ncbi:MAG: sugar ABC transporter substrate-binding protein [Anaerolineae bacterium]|jgi:ABC-type glycerol-3-phosphate transport system substrate-binding protein|nr:sugar ABC transporter substrate-binding protein [Anaerolineae bacterium]